MTAIVGNDVQFEVCIAVFVGFERQRLLCFGRTSGIVDGLNPSYRCWHNVSEFV